MTGSKNTAFSVFKRSQHGVFFFKFGCPGIGGNRWSWICQVLEHSKVTKMEGERSKFVEDIFTRVILTMDHGLLSKEGRKWRQKEAGEDGEFLIICLSPSHNLQTKNHDIPSYILASGPTPGIKQIPKDLLTTQIFYNECYLLILTAVIDLKTPTWSLTLSRLIWLWLLSFEGHQWLTKLRLCPIPLPQAQCLCSD